MCFSVLHTVASNLGHGWFENTKIILVDLREEKKKKKMKISWEKK